MSKGKFKIGNSVMREDGGSFFYAPLIMMAEEARQRKETIVAEVRFHSLFRKAPRRLEPLFLRLSRRFW
jgi:hypothetical protein